MTSQKGIASLFARSGLRAPGGGDLPLRRGGGGESRGGATADLRLFVHLDAEVLQSLWPLVYFMYFFSVLKKKTLFVCFFFF